MDLYKEYLNELHDGKSVIHNETGFIVYWIRGEGKDREVYIEDIYTRPEFRLTKSAAKLADQVAVIAKENGCTYMTGSVVPSANNSTISLKMMIGYGFELAGSQDNFIWFSKEI